MAGRSAEIAPDYGLQMATKKPVLYTFLLPFCGQLFAHSREMENKQQAGK